MWFATVENKHLEVLVVAEVLRLLQRLLLELVAKGAFELRVHSLQDLKGLDFNAKQIFKVY